MYIVDQKTNLSPKASIDSTDNFSYLTDQEKKIIGVDETGKISDKRAKDLAEIAPNSYQQLVVKGLVNQNAATLEEKPSVESPINRRVITISNLNISSCGDINTSGNYKITQDLLKDHDACIYIHDTSNVNLDCQNHTISSNFTFNEDPTEINLGAFYIKNVQNFSIKNCQIKPVYTPYAPTDSQVQSVRISGSNNGILDNNTISGGWVDVRNSNKLQLTNNNFNTFYQQVTSSFNQFKNNNFKDYPKMPGAATLILSGGHDNVVDTNRLDGQWDSVQVATIQEYKGADDGILLNGESSDKIINNTITNNWDCGIESVGFIHDSQFSGNNINNMGFCGIGAWYWNSWLNNRVENNNVNKAATLFYFFRSFGLDTSQNEQTVYFKNNTFSGNVFTNQAYVNDNPNSHSTLVDFVNLPNEIAPSEVTLGQINFTGNNFNPNVLAPILIPSSMVVDGGGNQCLPSDDPTQNNLACQNGLNIIEASSSGKQCGRIVTAAINSQTGDCKVFPTSCIPDGFKPNGSSFCPQQNANSTRTIPNCSFWQRLFSICH